MTDWKEQYLAALTARAEAQEQTTKLYEYCGRIADEKAQLQKKQAAEQIAVEPPAIDPPQPLRGYGIPRFTSSPVPQTPATIAALRQDLGKAQQERSELAARLNTALAELVTLKTRTKTDTTKIAQLSAAVQQLSIKVRDREEELKGKAKLVENVQDENVTLNLQLNVAAEQADKLKKENQELVDRWMVRMGREADEMNEKGKFS